MDTLGLMYFPEGVRETVKSTFVTVQGKLVVHANKLIDGVEDMNFVMTKRSDYIFMPIRLKLTWTLGIKDSKMI